MGKYKKGHILMLIIILALLSRLLFLDIRPLHHDEGVNYFFADNILEGRGFKYDPLNYHGPSYFFILFLSFFLLGVNEFSLRLPAALFGIILVLVPLFVINKNYNKYVLATFLLVSPSLMFYSRYSIHEMLFVLASFLAIYSLTSLIENKNLDNLPLFAFSLGILVTTKETTIILLFIMAVICAVNYKEIKKINFGDRDRIILSVLLFILIYVVLFTSFFTNMPGLKDSVGGYLPWTERGVTEPGHQKSFLYYFWILVQYELPLVLLALVGTIFAYKNRHNLFVKNMAIWFVLIFLIYSLIGYKTPWLIVNISVPMIMMASIGVKSIYNRRIMLAIFRLSVIYLVFFSLYLNFVHTWEKDNYFAYVHTDSDVLNLVKETNLNYGPREKILIVSDTYWPLPFYFDNKKVEYLDKIDNVTFNKNYDYYIVKKEIFVNSTLPNGYKYREYKLRDDVPLDLVYKIE